MLRIRTHSVVRTYFRIPDNTGLIDDQPGRHRKGPGRIIVIRCHVDIELQVDGLEFFRYGIDDAVDFRDLIPRVAENVEEKLLFFPDGTVVAFKLRRDGNQPGAG